MSRRLAPSLVSLLLLVLLAVAPAAASAAPACRAGGAEVRFDDGRLLVTRAERAINPRNVVEGWWACWRPTGRRHRLVQLPHARSLEGLALLAVRRGHFVVIGGRGYLDTYDARTGKDTASVPEVGALRELRITPQGRMAALEGDERALQLWAGAPHTRCLLDAGPQTTASGSLFGDLAVHGEHLGWYRDGVHFGEDLSRLSC